jgi:hypothetical protein
LQPSPHFLNGLPADLTRALPDALAAHRHASDAVRSAGMIWINIFPIIRNRSLYSVLRLRE